MKAKRKSIFILGSMLISLCTVALIYIVLILTGLVSVRNRIITVISQSAEKVYDGTPLICHEYTLDGELEKGASLDIEFTAQITNAGSVENTFTLKVVDQNNYDISNNYDITCIFGNLTVTQMNLIIETGSAEKLYDGTSLECNDYSLLSGNIAAGDTITISYPNSITEIGSVKNQAQVKIVNSDGIDVSSSYNVDIREGTLEVKAANLVISTDSLSKVYDGIALVASDENWHFESGELLEGHSIDVRFLNQITDVGTVDNNIKATIYDEYGNDVTKHYNIEVMEGKLDILPIEIEISTPGIYAVYDGKEHYSYEDSYVSAGALLNGHYLKVVDYTKVVGIGEKDKNIVSFNILDENNADVSKNYKISYSFGVIDIAKREITIKTLDASKVFDNLPLLNIEWNYIENSLLLADGHTLVVEKSTTIIDAQVTNNCFIDIKILDENLNDVTINYIVNQEYGTLTIDKRPIKIITPSIEKEYDGLAIDNSEYNVEFSESLGELITVVLNQNIIDAGEYENKIINLEILLDDMDVTKNYIHEEDEIGVITITKRKLEFTTPDFSKQFDGKYYSSIDFEYNDNLALTDNISLEFNRYRNAGLYQNEAIAYIYRGDVNATESYDISYIFGSVTITPIDIIYASQNYSKVYDGTPLEGLTDSPSLGENSTIYDNPIYTNQTTLLDVGSIPNSFSVLFIDNDGNDVSQNYNVIYNYGNLTITKAKLDISYSDISKVYDGTELNYTPDDAIISGLALDTEKVIFTFPTGIINTFDSYDYSQVSASVYRNTLNITDNYEIDIQLGEVTIYKRDLNLVSPDLEYTYNGSQITFDTSKINVNGLVGADKLYAIGDSKIDCGRYNNYFSYRIYNTIDVTENYNVTITYGIVTINKALFHYRINDKTKVFDGTILEFTNDDIIIYSQVKGSDYARFTFGHGIIYVNDGYDSSQNSVQIYRDGIDVSYNYDIVNDNEAPTLTITKNALLVEQTQTVTKTYDATVFTTKHNMLSFKPSTQMSIENYFDTSSNILIYQIAQIIDANLYENEFAIELYLDGINITDCFDIDYKFGRVLVEKFTIEISQIEDKEQIYNGKPLTISMTDLKIENEAPEEIELQLVNAKEITNVGSSLATAEFEARVNNQISNNYTFKFNAKLLTVIKRNIEITTGSKSEPYAEGKIIYEDSFKLTDGSLCENHYIVAESMTSLSYIGKIENRIAIMIYDGSGNSVKSNYSITFEYGYLEMVSVDTIAIQPESVKLSADLYSYYDASEHNSEIKILGLDELIAKGYTYSATFTGRVDGIGSADLIIDSIAIYDEQGRNVTSSYKIILLKGKIQIYNQEITVVTSSATKEYDGNALVGTIESITGLSSEYSYQIITTTSLNKIGMAINYCTIKIMHGSDDVTDDFNIKYSYGILTINPITLRVTFTDKQCTSFNVEGLLSGDRLLINHAYYDSNTNEYIIEDFSIESEENSQYYNYANIIITNNA